MYPLTVLLVICPVPHFRHGTVDPGLGGEESIPGPQLMTESSTLSEQNDSANGGTPE